MSSRGACRGHNEPVQHPAMADERPPSTRPMPYQRPSRDGLTRNRVQVYLHCSSMHAALIEHFPCGPM